MVHGISLFFPASFHILPHKIMSKYRAMPAKAEHALQALISGKQPRTVVSGTVRQVLQVRQ
jgi:hypothetical protein